MKKNTLIKILCLVIVCLMVLPFVVACSSGNNSGNNGGNNGGGNNGGGAGEGQVTISYDPGTGLLGDDEWEKVVDSGSRWYQHPTPTHNDESMMFDGWYVDDKFVTPVNNSTKYTVDTTLYAKWTKVNQCMDGTYFHSWGSYYPYSEATCTAPAIQARDCPLCGSTLKSEDATNNPALGHDWGAPTEAGFASVRACRRTGCQEKQYSDFTNVTKSALGNNPSGQIELLSGSGWGLDKVPGIVDGIWDHENSATMAGKGDEIKIEITLFTPMEFDRIYVKGRGSATFNVYVKYANESEFTLLGSGAFLGAEENAKDPAERKIPFVEVDGTKVVEKVQIVMPTPSNGSDYWEECGFFKLP